MSALEKGWYDRRQWWVWLLAPLTIVFGLVSSVRRVAYRRGWKQTQRVSKPVIVVGNISVGGTGKTPLVIRLCEWLRQQGYYPGVISRGYGGKAPHYPYTVTQTSDPRIVGDEPLLIRQHLPCPLVVDPNRARGAQFLVDEHRCNVIVSDDGLQHYAMQRDMEIIVLDGKRRLGNGYLLPMGPLREGKWRLKKADFVVLNGGQPRSGEALMTLESGHLINVKYPNQSRTLSSLKGPVVAAAGIGNPERFFELLQGKGVKLKSTLVFGDHHPFRDGDLPDETVLMTEKDAVKCREFAASQWWYLPVSAKLSEQFKQDLLNKLKVVAKEKK